MIPLGATDRAALLGIARGAVLAHLGLARAPILPEGGPLAEPRGAFVTLHVSGDLRGCIGSFRPLTDQARIGVKPARVRIVTLPTGMTLSEFNRRYPSDVPIERLTLLNGVSADSTLPAGTLAKRVVK